MIALATHRRPAASFHEKTDYDAVLSTVTGQSAALALDCLEQGVFILDASLRVQLASAAAKRLIETGRMRIQNGHLCSSNAAETMTLRRLIIDRMTASSFGPMQMIFHRLNEAEGALCLGITAVRQPLRSPIAIVLVSRPSQLGEPDIRQLRDYFGLTEAQARLAIEIAKGHGLQVCARQLGIAVSTARSHLRQIFEKTETKRQAEFVRLAYACRFPVAETDNAETPTT